MQPPQVIAAIDNIKAVPRRRWSRQSLGIPLYVIKSEPVSSLSLMFQHNLLDIFYQTINKCLSINGRSIDLAYIIQINISCISRHCRIAEQYHLTGLCNNISHGLGQRVNRTGIIIRSPCRKSVSIKVSVMTDSLGKFKCSFRCKLCILGASCNSERI